MRIAIAVLACIIAMPAQAGTIASWRPYIVEASHRCGVPTSWIERVMRAESGGQTRLNGRPIRSSAGAIGLMQLMPGTWADMRRTLGLGVDPDDPRDNIVAGSCYLRLTHDRFGHPGLFAAYNAGPARYAAHLATGRALPAETVDYLAQVGGQAVPAPMRAIQSRRETLFFIAPRSVSEPVSQAGALSQPSLFALRRDVP